MDQLQQDLSRVARLLNSACELVRGRQLVTLNDALVLLRLSVSLITARSSAASGLWELTHCTLLFPPHSNETLNSLIVRLVYLHRVQSLPQDLLGARILASSQQLFHSLDEALVEASREGRPRVVAQDANQHNSIVLDVWLFRIVATEEVLDLLCGGGSGDWRGLGCFDYDREVEDFFVAVGVGGSFAEKANAARSVCFGRVDGCVVGSEDGAGVAACELFVSDGVVELAVEMVAPYSWTGSEVLSDSSLCRLSSAVVVAQLRCVSLLRGEDGGRSLRWWAFRSVLT